MLVDASLHLSWSVPDANAMAMAIGGTVASSEPDAIRR